MYIRCNLIKCAVRRGMGQQDVPAVLLHAGKHGCKHRRNFLLLMLERSAEWRRVRTAETGYSDISHIKGLLVHRNRGRGFKDLHNLPLVTVARNNKDRGRDFLKEWNNPIQSLA